MADITVGLVQVVGPRKILVVSPGATFTPEEAREMARNLEAAASASEQISPILLPKSALVS